MGEGGGGGGGGGGGEGAPSESAIKEVLTVLSDMSRSDAVALLQSNHNNSEDAVLTYMMQCDQA